MTVGSHVCVCICVCVCVCVCVYSEVLPYSKHSLAYSVCNKRLVILRESIALLFVLLNATVVFP